MAKKKSAKKSTPRTPAITKKATKKVAQQPISRESLLRIVNNCDDELKQCLILRNLALESLREHFPEEVNEFASFDLNQLDQIGALRGAAFGGEMSRCERLKLALEQATNTDVIRWLQHEIRLNCN